MLANEGLLILSPNRGASVARVSPEEVDELFPIMGAMEALAGEAACANATEAVTRRYFAGSEALSWQGAN